MLLVASPYHQPLDPKEVAAGKPYPPIGPLVSVAALRAQGHTIAMYDPMFTRNVELFADALRGHKPRAVAIIADPHAVPVKMCLTSMRTAALRMVELAKQAGACVFVSGPDPTDHPEPYLAAGADTIATGEHDEAVLAWAKWADPLAGAASASSGPNAQTSSVLPRNQAITQLDSLPDPAFESIDLAAYARRWRKRHGHWELSLSTARGCPYRCNWCAKPTWGRTYHAASPERAAAMVANVRAAYAPDRIWFTDDIFAVKPAWLARYRELVGGDPLPFRCNTRADLVREGEYVKNLVASGCIEVWMGAESGSDSVLAAMDKDQTRADIDTAVARLRDAGIRVGFFLQLGYPGETHADVLGTLEMVRELRPDEIGVSVSYPLPGTVFYERVAAKLRKFHWENAMDNEVLFAGAFPQGYYDSVRELLRAQHARVVFQPQLSRAGARKAAALPYHAVRAPWHQARAAWYARNPK